MTQPDVPSRLSASLADRYGLERELGSGGMATVYLAEDLKHGRKVAIKVLHPELSAVIGGDRFLTEIKTTASLQHPHILGLIDSGEADGLLYYVMPFIEGETLRGRLAREKQLPVEEAVRLTREVASALEFAHKRGIVHRDIKPENILLQDGQALVADFGIALAVQQAGGNRMTQTGMSLGTPAYMSPEQAMGERDIGPRSDVYALGAMAYEMLAGEPPFTGPSSQAIVAKVLTEAPPPLRPKRPTVNPAVEGAILTALQKLPADRFTSAAEFAAALTTTSGAAAASTYAAKAPVRLRPAPWRDMRIWAGAAVGALVLWAGTLWTRPPTSVVPSRLQVVLWKHRLPSPLDPGTPLVATQAAIAPDGSSIVYSDSAANGLMLWRKLRDAASGTVIAGTEGAVSPFFSPDGRWVGYLTLDGKLRKVPVEGGGSITLAENVDQDYRVGAWLDDQTIVYSERTSLSRIPADGGTAARLFRDGQGANTTSLWPLPGSRGFLFSDCVGNCALESTVYVFDFKADSARLLVPQAAGAWYSPTGHLLYTSRDGGLYAAPFDAERLQLTGGAVPVLDNVEPTRFTLSPSGDALYSIDLSTQAPSSLVWVTRDGRAEPVDSAWRGQFEYPAISPDGKSVAVSVRGNTTDLWIWRADGTRQKVIADGIANWRPSWTPDGQSLAFISIKNPTRATGSNSAYLARADGVGAATPLLADRSDVWEVELSRDGQWLVFRSDEKDSDSNIRARRLTGDTTPLNLLTDPSLTLQAALSPDSRWLAYCSNEAGSQYEVYVASFPDMASKRLVSRGGGSMPRWARSGRELFFESGSQLMTVSVPPGPVFSPGTPHPLFSLAGYRGARNRPQYDVAPGDQRFVMIRDAGTTATATVYAQDWFAELRAKVKR